MQYESPTLETVGSLHELTLGSGGPGDADTIFWVFTWGTTS